MLSANVVQKTSNLVNAAAGTLANAKTLGFSADIQVDISATIQKDSHESTTQKGSSLLTGGNLVIKSGSTAKIEGSDAAAQGDILIDARNVEITTAKNTEKTHSTSYTEHLNFTASYATNNSWGINGDTSHTWSNSESESRVNSHLNANNITIKSVKDTTVRGGVVAANNSVDLDVGGNLVVESLQDKSSSSSYSYGVNGGYSETRDKDNNKTGSGNGGANFSVSMSERKWVTKQTSLTGSHVNIYVEKRTALTGAVIASTSNDLTLDTGSFEYSDIKDKDISWNGGLTGSYGKSYVTKSDGDNNDGDKSNSAKYNTWSASANYGYSEKRQTNFTTIGEGTIIVRDGNGSLAALKRDVSKSQYGTVDMGFQGGLTVDSSTVAMVKTLVTTNPKDIYDNARTELEKGYEDAAKTTEEIYEKSVVLYEKTTNYIGEKGFHTNGEVILIELQYKEAFAYFIPGTDEVQNGIRIIRGAGADGEILGITDYDYDGTQKNVYNYGNVDYNYTHENFIIVDGQQVKTYELIHSDGTRIMNIYDSTGDGVFRSAYSQYNDGVYDLINYNIWGTDEYGKLWSNGKQKESWDCTVTTYGNMTDMSRDQVLQILKSKGGIDEKLNMNIAVFAKEIRANLSPESSAKTMTDMQIRSILDNNLDTNTRTEIRFGSHSTMLSGARYNSDGTITHYWMNDPGRSKNTTVDRTTLRNQEWGKVQKARWLENKGK